MILPRHLYDLMVKHADAFNHERELVTALVEAESGWNPNAVGDSGHSVGLGQLHDQGAGAGMSVEDRKNPDINLRRTCEYLRAMVDNTPSIADALSAYNQGLGGWQQRGILPSQRHYIGGIIALRDRLRTEGIQPDDGAAAPPATTAPGKAITIPVKGNITEIIIRIVSAVV